MLHDLGVAILHGLRRGNFHIRTIREDDCEIVALVSSGRDGKGASRVVSFRKPAWNRQCLEDLEEAIARAHEVYVEMRSPRVPAPLFRRLMVPEGMTGTGDQASGTGSE